MPRHWSQQFPNIPCFSFLETGKLRPIKEIPFRPGKTQELQLGNNVDLGAPLLPSAALSDIPPALVPVCSLHASGKGQRDPCHP